MSDHGTAEKDAPWCPECGPTCPMHGTAENVAGCCDSCGGKGGNASGPCWDCRATGCAHPEPCVTPPGESDA